MRSLWEKRSCIIFQTKRSGNGLKMETNFTRDLCGFPIIAPKIWCWNCLPKKLMRRCDRTSCEFFGNFRALFVAAAACRRSLDGNAQLFFIRRESITKSAWLLAAGFVAKKEKYKLWVLEEIERNGKFPFCTTKTTTTTRARYLFETWNIPFHFIILDRSAEWHNHLNPTPTLMLRKFTISWIIRTANLIDLFGQRVEIKFAKKVNFRGHWTNFFSFCPICMRVWT